MEDLWSFLERNSVFIREDLKLILKATNYDTLYSMERFTEAHQKKIEEFMQTTLHEIIETEDREKYYGIFKNHPEKFKFIGGLEQSLLKIVEIAKKNARKNRIPKDSVSTSDTGSSSAFTGCERNSEYENNKDQIMMDLKTILDRNVNKYIQENYSDQTFLQISSSVAEDGFGSYLATIKCPFLGCEKWTKVTRNKSRWNTSNFYKHINVHATKQVEKPVVTFYKMLNKIQETNFHENDSNSNADQSDEEYNIKSSSKRKIIDDIFSSSDEDNETQSKDKVPHLENCDLGNDINKIEKLGDISTSDKSNFSNVSQE